MDELRGTETILVVDDDPDARRAMCRTLAFHGYTTLEAAGGEEAVEILDGRDEPVDLVLIDVVMPDMSGLDLGEEVRSSHPESEILFTSGYADEGIPSRGASDDRMHFVKKPMTIRELAAKVRSVLDGEG